MNELKANSVSKNTRNLYRSTGQSRTFVSWKTKWRRTRQVIFFHTPPKKNRVGETTVIECTWVLRC